jgi:hypothetical protein
METTASVSCIEGIGTAAGTVWRTLASNGPMTVAKLVKAVDEPRDRVMQAIGWLAREGKLDINGARRGHTIALRENAP